MRYDDMSFGEYMVYLAIVAVALGVLALFEAAYPPKTCADAIKKCALSEGMFCGHVARLCEDKR